MICIAYDSNEDSSQLHSSRKGATVGEFDSKSHRCILRWGVLLLPCFIYIRSISLDFIRHTPSYEYYVPGENESKFSESKVEL